MMKEKHGLQVKILKMFKMSIPCGSCFFTSLKNGKIILFVEPFMIE